MGELRDLLTKVIKEALYETMLIPNAIMETPSGDSEDENFDDEFIESQLPSALFVREEDELPKNVRLSEESEPKKRIDVQTEIEFAPQKNVQIKALELHPVGIAMGTYIIAENKEGVYLIDQHAAVERINYEQVLKGLLTNKAKTLLVPLQIELSSSDMTCIKSHFDMLKDMGFDLEEFGINTIRVNAHPIWIKESLESDTIRAIFDLVIEEKEGFDILKFNDKMAATIACKKSLKGNTRITLELAKTILENLVLCDNPYNCPHGRPTIVKFTTYELEKMFKRVM